MNPRIGLIAALVVWSLVALCHYYNILRFAVNIPFMDEWEYLNATEYLGGFDGAWFVAKHNEHRMVPTNFLFWILYRINSWNGPSMLALSFALYLASVGVFVRLLNRIEPRAWAFHVMASIFLLSTLPWENHSWGFQTAFHFMLGCSFIALLNIFELNNWRRLISASLATFTLIYTMTAGVAIALIFAGLVLLSWLVDPKRLRDRSHIVFGMIYFAVIAVGVGLHLHLGSLHFSAHPPWVLPHQFVFWDYFFNIVGSGFGVSRLSWVAGALLLSLALFPLAQIVVRSRGRLKNSDLQLIGAFAVILGILGTISVGRAGFGIGQGKSSRYCEISTFLVPLTLVSWSYVRYWSVLRQRQILCFLFVGFGYLFHRSWFFAATYEQFSHINQTGKACVEAYYDGQNAGDCPDLYPGNISARLEIAKRLKVSFYRDWLTARGLSTE